MPKAVVSYEKTNSCCSSRHEKSNKRHVGVILGDYCFSTLEDSVTVAMSIGVSNRFCQSGSDFGRYSNNNSSFFNEAACEDRVATSVALLYQLNCSILSNREFILSCFVLSTPRTS